MRLAAFVCLPLTTSTSVDNTEMPSIGIHDDDRERGDEPSQWPQEE